jgi:phage gp36-like protein
MAAYSDKVSIKNYIPAIVVQQLTDDADTDSIDDEKLNFALRQATDVIDGYLRGRYPVPLTGAIPTLISDLCTKLAVYFLIQRSLIITMPDPVKDQYDNSISILKQMQQGKINAFEAAAEPIFFKTNKKATDKIFTTTPTLATQNNWSAYPI